MLFVKKSRVKKTDLLFILTLPCATMTLLSRLDFVMNSGFGLVAGYDSLWQMETNNCLGIIRNNIENL